LVLVVIVGLSAESQAAPIKYEYGGVITSADPSTGVAPGTRFSGWFSYDPTAKPVSALMIEGMIQYGFGRVPGYPSPVADGSGITLQIGDRTVVSDPGGVAVQVSEVEYPGQWSFEPSPKTGVVISSGGIDDQSNQASLSLRNTSRAVFGSLAPPSALNLADFPDAKLTVTELTHPGERQYYAGTIDSLQPVPIPEPASLACWVLAALGVTGMARRRKRTN
jgi:hypothetical protein